MKKLLSALLLLLIFSLSLTAYADVWVNGYTRSNGTYVSGHYRSDPNSTVTDNYSFYGNRNPYTGTIDTNRYYSAPSSPYYNPYRYSLPTFPTYNPYTYPHNYSPYNTYRYTPSTHYPYSGPGTLQLYGY